MPPPKITVSVTRIRRLTLYTLDQGPAAISRLMTRAHNTLENRNLVLTELYVRPDNLGGTYLIVHTETEVE